MWKEIIEFVRSVSSKENNLELMSYYIEYVIPFNPFKRVKNSPPNKISDDIRVIKNIQKKSASSEEALNHIKRVKLRSDYVKDNLQNCISQSIGIVGLNQSLKDAEKYIEMTFILRSIEKYHNYERLKSLAAILLSLLTLVATIKIAFIKASL